MSRSNSCTLILASFTFLDDWTFFMWSFMIYDLAWSLDIFKRLSMFSYSYMFFLGGGWVCRCLRFLNFWRRLFFSVSNLIFYVYFLWYIYGQVLVSFLQGPYREGGSQKVISCEIFIGSSIKSDLGPSWKDGYPPQEIIMPCEDKITLVAWTFLFDLVVPVLCPLCLLVIIFQVPGSP